MTSCCLDCVKFEAVQNSKIMQCLDNVLLLFKITIPTWHFLKNCNIKINTSIKRWHCIFNPINTSNLYNPNSVNGIDLFEYGFEDLCVGCLNVVSCFLIKNLQTVK